MKHEQYGLAAYLSAHASGHRSLAELNHWIMPAIQMGQIMFAFDRAGVPLAYWTWANLAEDVERRLMADSYARLHESEWNEGGRLLVLEFAAPFDYVGDIARYVRYWAGTSLGCAHFKFRRGVGNRLAMWSTLNSDRYRVAHEMSARYRLTPPHFAKSHSQWRSQPDRPSTAF